MKNIIVNSNFKYSVQFTSSFKKDFKTIKKRHLEINQLLKIISLLANGKELPAKYHNHQLSGKWVNFYECHIAPDWLLVYKIQQDKLILTLIRTGTHSDIF